ncbi:MAG: AAA family ATPase [Chloroflexi bacterium]|nr:AAA family ATPase [Ardenticatenaceae bacterium]MBL1128376.1 AAA family ATPase [Chloroflexota bacterium]NOG34452.1 AAA family ATPase [Chloroflexota bacterium]GIK57660.1 MAG: single-stranded DNA-binding protein [Chloroflexota bacterium]
MSTLPEQQTKEDLQLLLAILPETIREPIEQNGREADLLEVVMDLGRQPTARYVDGEIILRQAEVTAGEIAQVVNGIGDFDDDNRAGITRTLHRISGIRNRRSDVVGLTCRVGRAVYGTIDIVTDIIEEGHSVLLLGRPGVGKTTMLREMARVLAEKRRVVIVDTSNEIGGDGDIPHPAVGRARRMQVARPSRQHETMIEAVENHNPEVIIIDEIGREQEAAAARTINERGVQLIGTAHGKTLENLLLNPTLSDLVGGIESVTLSDEEARRRGTQKTVLERRAPPTFDVLIEIQDREKLLVHPDVTSSVDAMLRGEPLHVQFRSRDDHQGIRVEDKSMVVSSTAVTGRRDGREARGRRDGNGQARIFSDERPPGKQIEAVRISEPDTEAPSTAEPGMLNVYAYGVARNRLLQASRRLRARINLVNTLADADVLVTLKSYYRKRSQLIRDAERRRTPVYVLRANTVTQMESFLAQALKLDEQEGEDPFETGIADVERGIQMIHAGQPSVDLRPVSRAIRAYQHQLVRQANLVSHSYGKEPNRYVRIFNTPRLEN